MRYIIDFFVRIYEWVISIFSKVWEYLSNLIKTLLESLISPLIDAIPDFSPMWNALQVIQPYTAFVNQWIALDTASTLLGLYFTFALVMITIKLTVKLFIPTVG